MSALAFEDAEAPGLGGEGGDRADRPLDHAYNQRDHHGQGQGPLPPPRRVDARELPECRRVERLGQAIDDDRIWRRNRRALTPVAPDRPRAPGRASLLGRRLGGGVSLTATALLW